MCFNLSGPGETETPYDGPVLLVYNKPDPDSKVGGWKTVIIDMPSYDMAVMKSFELPRVYWGEIRTFDNGTLIEKFGVEER